MFRYISAGVREYGLLMNMALNTLLRLAISHYFLYIFILIVRKE